MLEQIGVTFPKSSQWYEDEIHVIESLTAQINARFPEQKNLFVNTTWFGPQFNNGQYEKFEKVCAKIKFDNLFLLAAADPVFLADYQIKEVHQKSGADKLYLIGHFDSPFAFNFHSTVLPKYFKSYPQNEVMLKQIKYLFINYNRKPRPWRSNLVSLLCNNGLDKKGIVTLGEDNSNNIYDDKKNISLTLGETVDEIGKENQWWPDEFGIPHDIHSLGRLALWQQHFLTVVGETEGNNDVPTFVSEKTWKPIIGLRPFIINGQRKVYQWLRSRGFKTFNQYWKHINVEEKDNTPENCINVINYLNSKTNKELLAMYQDMLPDLLYNKQRFYEFSREQKHKMENIFK